MTKTAKERTFDALFERRSEDPKVTREQAVELERRRDWFDRLLANRDFVDFLAEIELRFGGLNYGTEEVDAFTQGKLGMLGDIKSMLLVSERAPKVFAEITRRFYQDQTDGWQEILLQNKKETTDE